MLQGPNDELQGNPVTALSQNNGGTWILPETAFYFLRKVTGTMGNFVAVPSLRSF